MKTNRQHVEELLCIDGPRLVSIYRVEGLPRQSLCWSQTGRSCKPALGKVRRIYNPAHLNSSRSSWVRKGFTVLPRLLNHAAVTYSAGVCFGKLSFRDTSIRGNPVFMLHSLQTAQRYLHSQTGSTSWTLRQASGTVTLFLTYVCLAYKLVLTGSLRELFWHLSGATAPAHRSTLHHCIRQYKAWPQGEAKSGNNANRGGNCSGLPVNRYALQKQRLPTEVTTGTPQSFAEAYCALYFFPTP